jgi:Leucine-rich repeat (LRR) protein
MNGFDRLPNLRNLSLQNNEMVLIENYIFSDLHSLEELHLENNYIVAIGAYAFGDLFNLVALFLSHNQLTEYDSEWFGNNPRLAEIYLDRNFVTKIPPLAFAHQTLGTKSIINFDHNQITEISADLFEAELTNAAWSVSLKHNNISCMDGNFGTFFTGMFVYLDENPLTCNCLQRIVDYTKHNEHSGVSFTKNDACHITWS